MVKTTVYLEEHLVRSLRTLSKRRRKPQAELIREAVRKLAFGEPPPLPAGVGMFEGRETDTSVRRKEILREAARSGRWR
jgi:hypothetical protein